MDIRPESPDDYSIIYELNKIAFEQEGEAELVNGLRNAGALSISLVAVDNQKVIGHIAFSPVSLEPSSSEVRIAGLAPMAILPPYQGRGIGSSLVRAGLKMCEQQGYHLVVVLGHPEYYARFGFQTAKTHKITWEHSAPEEAFMVVELQSGALKKVQGIIKYHPVFATL